jgi:beta-galactosidase GanA
MSENKMFLYGSQYHRPPNPPKDQHNYHLDKIKNKLGFNIIKVFGEWSNMHVGPDQFNFEELDKILGICDKQQLNVLIQTRLESAPYWLGRNHPETRYVSANGHAIELGPNANTQCGGYPGLCFHNEPIIGEAKKFLKSLVNHFKDRKCLIGYDCWNEPHLEPAWIDNLWANMGDLLFCYCDATRREFRSWLKKKYRDIHLLNEKWTRRFREWEEINPPSRHGHYADWLDWSRFWFNTLSKDMSWRYRIIKGEDPEHFVMSHSGAVPPFLARANAYIHNWGFAEPVDKWGTSFAPKFHNWSIAECAGVIDATRSAARGKEIWISEMTGGAAMKTGFMKTPVTRPRDIRTWNWLSIAYGAKAILYWCYLTESTGLEATSFGLVKYDGQTTPRAREAANMAKLINEYYYLFEDYVPENDIAVLYDPDNSSLLFAMENTDELYVQSHIGYYRSIWKNDLYAKYVTYSTIDELRETVLIVPMCLTLTPKAAQSIKRFVENGGVLITDARMGLFDENGFLQAITPPYELSEVAGLREDEGVYSDSENRPWLNNREKSPWPDEINNGPEITVTGPHACRFRVHGYAVPLLLDGAECIGKWRDTCLVAHHKHGKGEVYYFGTYFGLALFRGDRGAFSMLSGILDKYTTPVVKGDTLRPRLVQKDNEALLMIFNDDKNEEHSDIISIPEEHNFAFDIMSKDEVPIENHKIEISVHAEDAVLLHLKI